MPCFQEAPMAPTPDRRMRRVALASFIGTTVEWYDFYIYATAASLVFAKLFFPGHATGTGTLLAFATYAVGSVGRPLGAIVFGHVGDKAGRKLVLTVTLTLMGLATVLIGVLPSHATIGIWVPILLTFLRLVQSFGVGGEWGGAVLLAVEHAPKKRRMFYGSLPQTSSAVALMLSTGIFGLLALAGNDALLAWGWRVPFLIAAPFIAIGLWVRSVEETPEFTEVQRQEATASVPLAALVGQHWRPLVLGVGAVLITISGFYLSSTFMIFYGVDQRLFDESQMLNGVTFTGLMAIIATPLGGILGDRYGARGTMIWATLACALVSFPMFWLTETGVVGWMWIGMSLVMVANSFAYGALSGLLSGWFPAQVRSSGISVAYQVSGVLGSGLAPVVATALYAISNPAYLWVAVFLAAMSLLSMTCVLGYRGRDHLAEPVTTPMTPATGR
ncbi:MAG: MFS transporter [Streptosporangiales bacterium]|nr:MFS transporter [Streptosporangiales bacterium]